MQYLELKNKAPLFFYCRPATRSEEPATGDGRSLTERGVGGQHTPLIGAYQPVWYLTQPGRWVPLPHLLHDHPTDLPLTPPLCLSWWPREKLIY
jgi:hypothetical protein